MPKTRFSEYMYQDSRASKKSNGATHDESDPHSKFEERKIHTEKFGNRGGPLPSPPLSSTRALPSVPRMPSSIKAEEKPIDCPFALIQV
jgi:hypothetical protein